MPSATNCGVSPVLALELDRNGNVSKKTMKLDREAQLTNSLLQGLYPGIHVATVDVPTEPLDSCEQAMVEQALTRIEVDGIRYSLVGASGSAKNGKFYAVESSFEKKLGGEVSFLAAGRHHLLRNSGVLVQGSRSRYRIAASWWSMIMKFGTNDCRGWISQSLFRKLQQKHQAELLAQEMQRDCIAQPDRSSDLKSSEELPLTEEEEAALVEQAKRRIHRQAKICGRIASINFVWRSTRPRRRAHSRSWRMKSREHLDADIILPRSCVKPKYQGRVLRTIRSLMGDRQAHTFRGPVMVGFRDVSRNLEFNSSYTLLEHAPEDSIELEIKPYALSQIEKVRQAFEANDFTELFELLGTKESQRVLEHGEEPDTDYTSDEYTVATGSSDRRRYRVHAETPVYSAPPAEGVDEVGVSALYQWWLPSSRFRTRGRWLSRSCMKDKWSAVRIGFQRSALSPNQVADMVWSSAIPFG